MQLDVKVRHDEVLRLLPLIEVQVCQTKDARPNFHLERPARLARVLAASCLLAACLVAAFCGANASAGLSHFVASWFTLNFVEKKPSRRELARRLSSISARLQPGSRTFTDLLEDLVVDLHLEANSSDATSPRRMLKGRAPLIPQKNILSKRTHELSDEDYHHGECGVNLENVIYSLSMVSLSAQGMSKFCPSDSPDFGAKECGGYFTNFFSELCWCISSALALQEDCALKEDEAVNCASQSFFMIANTFQGATDGIAIDLDCNDTNVSAAPVIPDVRRLGGARQPDAAHWTQLPVEAAPVGRRSAKRSRAGPRRSDKLEEAAHENVLKVLGLVGRAGRWRRDNSGSAHVKQHDVRRQGAEDTSDVSNARNNTRAIDVTACYFNAENTASTVVDSIFSIWVAKEACEDFNKKQDHDDEIACAASLTNFIADLATVAANVLILTSQCPVTPPPGRVACAADWVDMTAVLAMFATWGSELTPDCK